MTWKRVPTIALRDDQLPLVLVGLPGAGSDQTRAARQNSKNHDGVLTRMKALHAQRSPLYSEVTTLTIPTDGLSPCRRRDSLRTPA